MRDALLENGAAGIFGQVEIAGLNRNGIDLRCRERRGAEQQSSAKMNPMSKLIIRLGMLG
jgi:hypothetical protein